MGIYFLIVALLVCSGLCSGAGISIGDDSVTLDMGQVAPGKPVIWPEALQLLVQADAPWQLLIRGNGPFADTSGQTMPLERLAWAVSSSADTPDWTQMHATDAVIASGPGPTAPDGHTVAVGLRVEPTWDDAPGERYSTAITLTLNGGIDLAPSYVWPQPAVADGSGVSIAYHAGGLAGDPVFPVRLHIYRSDGEEVALVQAVATPDAWCTVHWNGLISNGAPAPPGAYSYRITTDEGQLLAQGRFSLLSKVQPAGMGSVVGVVYSENQPVAGVQVQLFDTTHRLVVSCTTAWGGQFRCSNLEEGAYHIEVRYPGYLPYIGERFTLSESTPEHQEEIRLAPNNALFITAALQVLSADPESSPQMMRPGDVVAVTGKLRNTGTRTVLAPQLQLIWPTCLQPVQASGTTNPQTDHTLSFTDLQPGESHEFSALAVVGLDVEWRGSGRCFIQLQATAWADNGNGNLQRVYAPPVFLPLDRQQMDYGAGGMLALRLYWDTNANGKADSDELPASGIKVYLSGGGQATSDTDGWIRSSVPSGPVSVWLPHPDEPAGKQVLYTTNLRPGEATQASVGLLAGQTQPAPFGDQAVLTVAGNGAGIQGAGDVAWQAGPYTLRLHPPHRWSATLAPTATTPLQHWMLDASPSNPTIGWRASFTELPEAPEPVRPAKVGLSLAAGGRIAAREVQLVANGSGPYSLPGPVLAVSRVALQQGRHVQEISADDYSWSPTGSLWLASPPEVLWPDADTSLATAMTLLVTYLPGSAETESELWPHLAATLVARPQRLEEQGLNLQEEFRLAYQQPWQQPKGLLRFRWERQSPGSTFTWEAGTTADPGSDPAAALMQPPTGTAGEQLGVVIASAPYMRIVQRFDQGQVQISASHERVEAQTGQLVSVSKQIDGPVQGRAALDAWHWQTHDAKHRSQLDAAGYLQASQGSFTLRVEQRTPLLQIGAEKSTQHSAPHPSDAIYAGSPGAQGKVQVAWQAASANSPRVAWQVDTVTGREQVSVDWDQRLTPELRTVAGWRVIGADHYAQASVQWSRAGSQAHRAQVRVEGQPGSTTGVAMYAAIQSEQFQAAYSVKPQSGTLARQAEIRLNTPDESDIYGTLYVQHFAGPANGLHTLHAGVTINGPAKVLGPGWQGSMHMEATAHRMADRNLRVTSGSAGVALRREYNNMAYAAGASLPWVHVAEGINQEAPLTWVALERRVAEWQGAGLWVGVELRRQAGRYEPHLQIRLK